MFDFARNMQLAVSDMARRAGLKAGAGVVALIGAGFLLAALWTFLADHLGWGSMGASLAIGGLFVVIGVGMIVAGGRPRHQMPTTDDLRAEVETRLSLAADIALDKARARATEVVDSVENRVTSLVDDVSYRAARFADDAEQKIHGVTGGFLKTAQTATEKVGPTRENLEATKENLTEIRDRVAVEVDRAAQTRAATIPPLVGAFAVGIALASRLQGRRHRNEPEDHEFDDQY